MRACVPVLAGDAVQKRQRTFIPAFAGQFIDSYLTQYTSKKGEQRKALVMAIKEAMDATDPTWGLSKEVIDTRLDNQLKQTNKKKEMAATAAAAVAEVEPVD